MSKSACAVRAEAKKAAAGRTPAERSKASRPESESLRSNQALLSMLQPRRCSCGGSCSKCSNDDDSAALRKWLSVAPGALRKTLEEDDADVHGLAAGPSRCGGGGREHVSPGEAKPHQGAATIVCDGSGGYMPQLNSWAGAPCGIEDCVRKHEESHARDWQKRYPDGCKNADGTPKAAGADIPLGGPGYSDFLKKSECDAYTVEVPCEEAALSNATTDECKTYVKSTLDDTKKQQKSYCEGGC